MDTKQAYKEKLEAQLEHARAELDALKASVKGMTADAKIAAAEQIETLEHTVAETKQQLAESVHASEDKWSSIKSSLAGAWTNLTHSFKRDSETRDNKDAARK